MNSVLYSEFLASQESVYSHRESVVMDANQQRSYERVLTKLQAEMGTGDDFDLEWEAAEITKGLVPTARQAARAIADIRAAPAYCYLAFHGTDGEAQYLKVGMTTHPEQRLYSMATGNPLDCMWAYTCQLQSRREAYFVEQTILRHLSAHVRRGEWIGVGRLTKHESECMARSLSEVAKDAVPTCPDFSSFSYRDGRKVAA